MVKKIFRITIKLIGEAPPDFGLGAGVVGYQDVTFDLDSEEKYESPMFYLGIEEQANEVMHQFILAEIREIENEQAV